MLPIVHDKVYGLAPPIPLTVTEPLHMLQLGCVMVLARLSWGADVMVIADEVEQPFKLVAVTV